MLLIWGNELWLYINDTFSTVMNLLKSSRKPSQLSFRTSRKILKHFHQNWPVLTFCQEVFLERDMPRDLGTREPRTSSKISWAWARVVSQLKGKGGPAEVGRWEGKQSRCWGSQAVRAAFSTPYIKSNWWDSAWQSVWVASGLSL